MLVTEVAGLLEGAAVVNVIAIVFLITDWVVSEPDVCEAAAVEI